MAGTQLAAELRRRRPDERPSPFIPVLLATGYAERAELAASGLPLLAKPFGQAELAAAVEGCLDAHPAPDEQVVPFRAR